METASLVYEIRSDIEDIKNNPSLYKETNFDSRVQVIDYIEFNIIDRIEGLLLATDQPEELITLKQDAERLKRQLEGITDNLFRRLRGDIRAGVCSGRELKRQIHKYIRRKTTSGGTQDRMGYDSLDVLINGLFLIHPAPMETKDREPEMVSYQPTPARIILQLVEKANLSGQDVFYDLGSGLGQVPMLVNLLSGARAKGVEFEPAFCDYARACAADLNLSQVEFINVDARQADFSDGTAFFMYTPFEGRLLQQVLEKLHQVSRTKMIKLFTYGPCTLPVSRQSWLKCVDPKEQLFETISLFRSY